MTNVVLLGAGAIGRELLTQIATAKPSAQRLNICGVIDRSGVAFAPNGLSRRAVLNLCAAKASGVSVGASAIGRAASPSEAVDVVTSAALDSAIIVDVTAGNTHRLLRTAMTRGFDVVLANKLPIGSSQRQFDGLRSVARRYGRRIRCEATVGAGLPVIDTLQKLRDAGDEIVSIEGCPSGTLGYLFGELERDSEFSDALRRAIAAGYTEPDPRIDLSGLDVARKALILGRQIGFRGNPSAIEVESLVPEPLRELSLTDFLARAEELDTPMRERAAAAKARGTVLRYRAHVTRESIAVGVCEVARTDPLASLSGTDNQFAFTTTRYRERKLVITGPGAGTSVTAAGVYNDILGLVNSAV
jgi:aspartokinase/homoserine dehydrogenase 1